MAPRLAILAVLVVIFSVPSRRIRDLVVLFAATFDSGLPRFDSLQEQGIFLFATASTPALGPTQPPIHYVTGVKRPGLEADDSPPSSAEVNACSYTSMSPVRLHGMVLNQWIRLYGVVLS
jgi:hypothetical protein